MLGIQIYLLLLLLLLFIIKIKKNYLCHRLDWSGGFFHTMGGQFYFIFFKMLITLEVAHVLHNIGEIVIENFDTFELALFMRKIYPFFNLVKCMK
jgi:hypothetical protein